MIYNYRELIKDIAKIDHCGGKGKNLFLLKYHGFRVPQFLIIPFMEVRSQLENINLDIHDKLDKLSGLEDEEIIKTATSIKEAINEMPFTKEFHERLSNALDAEFAPQVSFAVRSSAGQEDGQLDSFAGMFESFLFVDKKQVAGRIKDCIASNFAPRVLKYKLLRGKSVMDYNMAVIVQEMVDSAKAGVIFTMNPEGNLNELMVSTAFGQGEGVVQGTAHVENYYLDRGTKAIRREAENMGEIVNETELNTLFEKGTSVERLFGKPQDIEFAFDKAGIIHFLQSRNITTIRIEDLKILDNSNIVESYPGISLPLTFSFARSAYRGTMDSAVGFFNLTSAESGQLQPSFNDLIAHVKGRIYYNLHNWYKIVQFILTSDRGLHTWEEFIGVSKGRTTMKKLGVAEKIRRYATMLTLFINHRRNCRRFFKKFDDAYKDFRSFLKRGTENPHSPGELLSYYDRVSVYWFSFWGVTLINDIFVYRFFAKLSSLCKTYGFEHGKALGNDLLCGIEGVESERPILDLLELKEMVISQPEIRLIFDEPSEEILVKLKGEMNSFSDRFFSYIEKYGDRTLEELKLESPNFRTNPELLVVLLQNYLGNNLDTNTFKEKQRDIRKAAEALIGQRQSFLFPKTWLFRFVLSRTREFIRNRENMRFARTRAYSLAKELFLQVGKAMVKQGIINEERDIFFLEIDDLRAFCEKGSGQVKKSQIAKRKEEYDTYDRIELPDRIVYTGGIVPELGNVSENIEHRRILRGIAISKGDVVGEALVVKKPGAGSCVLNKILVTRMTDPGWIFLMAQAKGIISEKGSPLSHTAIVGRELGIPTIVNVSGATSNIESGQTIHMDGHTGIVEVLK